MEPFKVEEHDFETWIERFEILCTLLNVIEENKTDMFLNLLGSEGNGLLTTLCTPEEPKYVEYEILVFKMKSYLKPRVSVLVEHYKFGGCVQKDNETITEFIQNLQELSVSCTFGNNVDEALRDQILLGVSDRVLQQKLLNTPDLTFGRATEICLAHEKRLTNGEHATNGEVNKQMEGAKLVNGEEWR